MLPYDNKPFGQNNRRASLKRITSTKQGVNLIEPENRDKDKVCKLPGSNLAYNNGVGIGAASSSSLGSGLNSIKNKYGSNQLSSNRPPHKSGIENIFKVSELNSKILQNLDTENLISVNSNKNLEFISRTPNLENNCNCNCKNDNKLVKNLRDEVAGLRMVGNLYLIYFTFIF
jgi:hypothetical protein